MTDNSGIAFRLIYNGEVLTWLIEGCPEYSQLCDFDRFLERVSPFATRSNRGCGVDEANTNWNDDTSKSSVGSKTQSLPEREESRFLLLSMLGSFVVGSLSTCMVIQYCRWRPRRRQRDESELVSVGKEPTEHFMGEPDIVID